MATIDTKYGKAQLNNKGYYRITTGKNLGRLLHRLIFEDFYQIHLSKDIIIHHNDGNKTNNKIWNLIPMTNREHLLLHNKQKNSLNQKKSSSLKGVPKSKEHIMNLCLAKNTSGYYRVHKSMENGKLSWRYVWKENGKTKSIRRKTIFHLKKEVIARGLEWFEIENGVRVD